jgi:hypothetical protein
MRGIDNLPTGDFQLRRVEHFEYRVGKQILQPF